jgi:hypothetical protein
MTLIGCCVIPCIQGLIHTLIETTLTKQTPISLTVEYSWNRESNNVKWVWRKEGGTVRKTVFSIKMCRHLNCLQVQGLVPWASFFMPKLLPTPSPHYKCSISQLWADCAPNLTNPCKRGRTHCVRNKNEELWSVPHSCCACVPGHLSTEVNFVLLRQFSIPVSLIVTPVIFGGLISNRSVKNLNPHQLAVSIVSVSQSC